MTTIPLAVGLEMQCRTCDGWHPLFEPPAVGTGGPDTPMLYYHCPPGSKVTFYAGSVGELSHRVVRVPQE